MVLTRKLDWYGVGQAKPAQPLTFEAQVAHE